MDIKDYSDLYPPEYTCGKCSHYRPTESEPSLGDCILRKVARLAWDAPCKYIAGYKVLDLVLTHKWYDMIASGQKRVEYRRWSAYWIKRLFVWKSDGKPISDASARKLEELYDERLHLDMLFKGYNAVRFHRAYTSTTMTFEIADKRFDFGDPALGAPKDERCINLFLGERIS